MTTYVWTSLRGAPNEVVSMVTSNSDSQLCRATELDSSEVLNSSGVTGATVTDALQTIEASIPVPPTGDANGYVSFRLYANASSPLVGTEFWGTTVLAATTLATPSDLGAGTVFQIVAWSAGAAGPNGRFRPFADLTSQAGPGGSGGGARQERWFSRRQLIAEMPLPMIIAGPTLPLPNPVNPNGAGSPSVPGVPGGICVIGQLLALLLCSQSGPGTSAGGGTGGGGASVGQGNGTAHPAAASTGVGGNNPLTTGAAKGFGGCGANGSTAVNQPGGWSNGGGGAGGGSPGTSDVAAPGAGGDSYAGSGGAGGGGGAGVGSSTQFYNGAAGGRAGSSAGGAGGIGNATTPTAGGDGENGKFLQSGAGGGGGGSATTSGARGGAGGRGGIPAGGGGAGGNGKGSAGEQCGGPGGIGGEGLIAILGYGLAEPPPL